MTPHSYHLQSAFIATFYRVMRNSAPNTPLNRIIRQAIHTTAPEWFVSVRTAMREMRLIKLAGKENYAHPNKTRKEMYLCLYRELEKQQAIHPYKSVRSLLTDIISNDAPRFFISFRTARYYIHLLLKKSNDR